MRPFKFRSWDEENGMIQAQTLYFDKDGNFSMPYVKNLMQFTGLLDKHGTEIYEGDIVKVKDDWETYGQNGGEIYSVIFTKGGFRAKGKYDGTGFWMEDGDDFSVLGNIYSNPELLKV